MNQSDLHAFLTFTQDIRNLTEIGKKYILKKALLIFSRFLAWQTVLIWVGEVITF